jgi:hypothetical protein
VTIVSRFWFSVEVMVRIAVKGCCFVRDARVGHGVDWFVVVRHDTKFAGAVG